MFARNVGLKENNWIRVGVSTAPTFKQMVCWTTCRKKSARNYMIELDEFTQAYVECALWSSMEDFDSGIPMDENHGVEDISRECLNTMAEDCAKFQNQFATEIEDDDVDESKFTKLERAGHDFWLTRNGHGAGFWDGDWPKHGDKLTAGCKKYGECNLESVNGKVYIL